MPEDARHIRMTEADTLRSMYIDKLESPSIVARREAVEWFVRQGYSDDDLRMYGLSERTIDSVRRWFVGREQVDMIIGGMAGKGLATETQDDIR
jgi:hypothetical protein